MAKVGKIAFSVILALGGLTGILAYYLFIAAEPVPGKIDSLYRTDLPPTANANNASTASSSGGSSSAVSVSGPVGGTLTILAGANVQGNPSYDPTPMTVKKGDAIQVVNKDTTPHTATSGKGAEDPNASKMFDTNIIAPGASAKISTASLNAGEYPFFCKIHPYMTGNLKVQ